MKLIPYEKCPFTVEQLVWNNLSIIENHKDYNKDCIVDEIEDFLENNWNDVCLLTERWWNQLTPEKQREIVLDEHEKILDRSSELIKILTEMDKPSS